MKIFKKLITIVLTVFLSSSIYAASEQSDSTQLYKTLSGLRLTSSYTNGFNLYNMDKYSKNSYGGTVGFEYTLLPEIKKNFDLGFYGRATVQNFVSCNVQLVRLTSCSFSNGIFCQWNLPQDFSVQGQAGAGFLISDIDFISAEKGTVNDIYYDFMLEMDVNARKTVLKFSKLNLLGSAGCHAAFYNEKSENFMSIGPTFGVVVDFKPSGAMLAGVKR